MTGNRAFARRPCIVEGCSNTAVNVRCAEHVKHVLDHDAVVGVGALRPPAVDLDEMFNKQTAVWHDEVREQALEWSTSAEPLDRVAAVGLLVRGGSPKSVAQVDLLAYLSDGPSPWAVAWVERAEVRAVAFELVRRAIFCTDYLLDMLDTFDKVEAAGGEIEPVQWAWAANERERLACVSCALSANSPGVISSSLEGLDNHLLATWGGAPTLPGPSTGWRLAVREAQGLPAWWLPAT